MRSRLLASFLLVAGCGSPSTSPDAGDDAGDPDAAGDDAGVDDGALSGTRLKLRWYDFSGTRIGGSEAHDTALDLDCAPQLWDDGTSRCTPAGYQVVYRDATCTDPVGMHYVSTACPGPLPAFFATRLETACGSSIQHVYPRGAEVTLAGGYYTRGGGACNGPYSQDSQAFYTLGTELLRTQLAPLTEVQPGTSGRYQQRFWESADGARLFGPVADTELSQECSFSRYLGDPTGTCQPTDVTYAQKFADATCTTPVGVADEACPAPAYVAQFEPTCARFDTRFHANAGPVTTIYDDTGAACAPDVVDPGYVYYAAAGTELTLPEVPYVVDDVAGRQLQIPHFDDGTSRVRAWGAYDAVNATECWIVGDGDAYRCIPSGTSPRTFYTDAACAVQVEITQVYFPDPSCAPPPAPRFTIRYTNTCDAPWQIYEVGAPITAPLYQQVDATCVEAVDLQHLRYRVGAELPITQFASGASIVDP